MQKKDKFYQGPFRPKNPEKYRGNIHNIEYRSSYELKLMLRLDADPSVISWSSEEFFIPYFSPVHKKWKRYFPDFKIKVKNRQGLIETLIVEIKPASQTKAPGKTRNKKKMIYEQATWAINQAKWDAAQKYCKKYGYQFKIFTEKELGIGQ